MRITYQKNFRHLLRHINLRAVIPRRRPRVPRLRGHLFRSIILHGPSSHFQTTLLPPLSARLSSPRRRRPAEERCLFSSVPSTHRMAHGFDHGRESRAGGRGEAETKRGEIARREKNLEKPSGGANVISGGGRRSPTTRISSGSRLWMNSMSAPARRNASAPRKASSRSTPTLRLSGR